MIHDSDGTPVVCFSIVHAFPSKGAAARHYGVTDNAIYEACEHGTRCAGLWWRYSDMPASVQPLRDPRERPVRREDGMRFASITSAVIDVIGNEADRQLLHRVRMSFTRAMRHGRPYRGFRYRLEAAEDLQPLEGSGHGRKRV